MNAVIWERLNFHVSFKGKALSGNVRISLLGSFMIDVEIAFNNMKSPSTKSYLTFLDMTI